MNAAVLTPLPDPARLPAAVLAVFVHVLLFMFLFFGVRWSSNTPETVVVELWTTPPSAEPVQEKVEPPPPPPPKPVPKVEPRPEPKVEVKPPPVVKKPDIVIEKDKKVVKPEPAKPKPEASKPKPEPAKPDNLKFDLTARMREELARELAKATPRAEPAKPGPSAPPAGPSADAGYAARIRAAIRNRIVVPADMQGNPEAIFDVIQLPTREVLSVSLRKSSGNRAYDEAVERAIRGASPLPPPDAPNPVQRQLELKFRPKDPL